MNVTIRHATPDDAYDRAVCHISSWRSSYKNIVPDEILDNLSVDNVAEKFMRYLENKDSFFYCATYDGKIIGHFNFCESRDEDKPNIGEIIGFYTIEEVWGKSAGKQMMDFAINEIKNMGYNEVILWVLEENYRARRFYEKCGFVSDGTRKEIIIGKPLIEIRYKKEMN